jgi:UDP-glucose 4-epimerase
VKAFYNDEVVNDVINIGSNIEVTILELAQTIIQATDSKSKVIHLDPLEEGDMKRRMPDNSKMLKILGRDLMALETGIKHVLHSDQFVSH